MILSKHIIKGYYRYVDDILVVYTGNTTNIHTVLDEFNSITPKLEFTLEEEQNGKINFLDFTIVKTHKGLSFDIYRKPTTTDIIIPKNSCHPFEQNTAAIGYHRDMLLSYRLSPECREKEKETIKQILANNKYDPNHDIPELKQKEKQHLNTHTQKKNGEGSRMSGRKPVTSLNYLKTRT